MRRHLTLAGLLVCVAVAATANAQSLTDVAKKEDARRKAVRAAAKVYTNDDLLHAGAASPSSTASTAATNAPSAGKPDPVDPSKTEQPTSDEPKKDEKYWRDRIAATRQAAAHDKVLLDALQSRVNALSTDFANTSDPAQRALVEQNRKTALGEMDRLTKDLDKQNKATADTQEEARKASVPPGWLR
jgi:hypothetical protein